MADHITNEEILGLYEQLRASHFNRVRKLERMRKMYLRDSEDLNIYITDPDGKATPAKAVVRPITTNTVNIGVEILTAQPMQIQVPPPSDKSAAISRAQKIENFLRAFWDEYNRTLGSRVENDLIFHAFLYGQQCALVIPLLDKDQRRPGRLPILIRVLNPENCYPYHDLDGLHSLIHISEMQAGYIKRNYGLKKIIGEDGREVDDDKFVPLLEFYNHEYKQYFAAQTSIWPEPIPHKFGFNPAVWGWGRKVPLPVAEEAGQSILAPMESTWHTANVAATIKLAQAIQYQNDSIALVEGQEGVDENFVLDLRPLRVNVLPTGSQVVWINKGRQPPEVDQIIQMSETDMQQVGWPPVVVGQAPFQQAAAAALNLLTHSGRLHAVPYQKNVEFMLSQINERILRSVETLGESIEITGMERADEGERGFQIKFAPKDVKGYYVNQVRLVPDLPTDIAQKAQVMNAATQGPNPWMTVETGLEEIWQMKDPGREMRRKDRQAARQSVAAFFFGQILPALMGQAYQQEQQAEAAEKEPSSARLMGQEPGRMNAQALPAAEGSNVFGGASPGPEEASLPPLIAPGAER